MRATSIYHRQYGTDLSFTHADETRVLAALHLLRLYLEPSRLRAWQSCVDEEGNGTRLWFAECYAAAPTNNSETAYSYPFIRLQTATVAGGEPTSQGGFAPMSGPDVGARTHQFRAVLSWPCCHGNWATRVNRALLGAPVFHHSYHGRIHRSQPGTHTSINSTSR